MGTPSAGDVTTMLLAWREGDQQALDALTTLVYAELRRLAHRYMRRERVGHLLQTTALVNEAYLRLVDSSRVHWQNRAHFFAVAAQVMRRVLVDIARSRGTRKRRAHASPAGDGTRPYVPAASSEDVIAVDRALTALTDLDPRKARVVELRYFGGLTVRETAEVLGVSADTVMRDWKVAKLWLLRSLQEGAPEGEDPEKPARAPVIPGTIHG